MFCNISYVVALFFFLSFFLFPAGAQFSTWVLIKWRTKRTKKEESISSQWLALHKEQCVVTTADHFISSTGSSDIISLWLLLLVLAKVYSGTILTGQITKR